MGNPDKTSSVCESLHPWPILNCLYPVEITVLLIFDRKNTMLVKHNVYKYYVSKTQCL